MTYKVAWFSNNVEELPKHVYNRKHVTIIMKGNHICKNVDNKVTSVIGYYEKHEGYTIPKWECDIKLKKCKGKISDEERQQMMNFLV